LQKLKKKIDKKKYYSYYDNIIIGGGRVKKELKRNGIYVNLEDDLYEKILIFSEEVRVAKSTALRMIINIFFQEDGFGYYKNNRKAGRSKNKKN